MNRMDMAYADFLAGMEPVFRDERDRWFQSLPFGMQRKAIDKAAMEASDLEAAASILYTDIGISHKLATQLMKGRKCETHYCPPHCL